MFGLGIWEIALIGGIFVVLFGAKKVAELGKGVGTAIRELRSSMAEDTGKDKGKGE